MKSLAKLLLIGIAAGTAIFFWQKNWHSASQSPPPVESTATPATPSASTDPATVSQPLRLQQTFNPLAHAKASLHSKLRQWKESEANDPDDEEGRARLLKEMLAMVTDENVAEIVQSLSAEEMNTSFGIETLHHWMQTDPTTASNWLAARPDTTEVQTMAVAEEWNKNPDGLQQYLDQLPDSPWKQTFLQDAGADLSLKDPLAAIDLAGKMNPGDAQTNLLRSVACGWVDTDPDAALDWVAGVQDPALREQLVASAVQAYALTDPAQAAAWLVSEVKSDGVVKDAAINILETWVATDPAGAANWASQFPEGEIKATAVKTVAQHWLQTDPAAANAWIQTLSGGSATTTN